MSDGLNWDCPGDLRPQNLTKLARLTGNVLAPNVTQKQRKEREKSALLRILKASEPLACIRRRIFSATFR